MGPFHLKNKWLYVILFFFKYINFRGNMKKLFLIPWILLLFTSLSATIYLEPTTQFKPRMVVSAVYIEHNNNVLLLHRQNNKSQGNKWGVPGGKVKKDETPLQAAIREVKEETGYDISNQLIENVGTLYIEDNETDHYTFHMFHTQLSDDPGGVKINFTEHKGFTWVTPAEGLKMDLMQDEDFCLELIFFPEKAS